MDAERLGLAQAPADRVRAVTGFSIGGVPPLGHDVELPTIIDESLRRFGVVWAAAGTPHDVFGIPTDELVRAIPDAAGDDRQLSYAGRAAARARNAASIRPERERHRLALSSESGAVSAVVAAAATASRWSRSSSTRSSSAGSAGELGHGRVERHPHLERRRSVAAVVEVEPGAEGELLGDQRLLPASEDGGQPRVGGEGGGAALVAGSAARSSRASVQRPSATCSPSPNPTLATSA